ncbi:DNA polymerase III subunit epsilon [Dokdonia sinensis]|uniref:DNA polymerase III subunit epsilon n=1 Tax=Dokdonia sinensis TaxID=2479847 RepID=A0A3M0G3E1_9FLAO|nr:exonuclease domain-containing protein [Dokdonia sinensis]RMB59501.1 DNA polymerase III subunit epsilon [Dokdonia sinensis]
MHPEIYTIIDVETTGKGINGNRITEICVVRMEDGVETDRFVSLVNPEQYIPPFITNLTGIDDQMVDDAPLFADIAERVAIITEGAIFVAHNVNFDYNVIRNEFKRMGINFTRKKLCTVRLSRKLIPNLFSYSLGNLCSSISIPLNNRHRAEGDTDATVILFQRILDLDPEREVINKFLNARSKEATLPPHLPARIIQELPETAGIYLFKDRGGKVIYVGKAINIKKRVLSHFYEKKNKEYLLGQETFQIDYEVTGNELCALLLESEYIQQYFPKYNRAQKMPVNTYTIISYENRRGIIQLAVAKTKYRHSATQKVFTKNKAIEQLLALCEEYELCPRFCGLQATFDKCSHYSLKNCKGICDGKENVTAYNKRVKKALAFLTDTQETFVIKEKGRTIDEEAFVYVDNGVYRGFGFVSDTSQISHVDALEDNLLPKKSTYHTDIILKSYLRNKKNPTIIALGATA